MRLGAGEDATVQRNVRLVKIHGLDRANYTSRQIGHILGLSTDYARREVLVARACERELVDMLAGNREWDHIFPTDPTRCAA